MELLKTEYFTEKSLAGLFIAMPRAQMEVLSQKHVFLPLQAAFLSRGTCRSTTLSAQMMADEVQMVGILGLMLPFGACIMAQNEDFALFFQRKTLYHSKKRP